MKHMLLAAAVLATAFFVPAATGQVVIMDVEMDDDDALMDFDGCYISYGEGFWIETNYEHGLQTSSGPGYAADDRATASEWKDCIGSGG